MIQVQARSSKKDQDIKDESGKVITIINELFTQGGISPQTIAQTQDAAVHASQLEALKSQNSSQSLEI